MKANEILSASLIDLIFDGRNKEYGAYHLRSSYAKRTRRALLITLGAATLVISGVAIAGANRSHEADVQISRHEYELTEVEQTQPKEEIPQPEPKQQEPVATVAMTAPNIVPEEEFDKPMPDVNALDSVRIGLDNVKGSPDTITFSAPRELPGTGDGFIEQKKKDEDEGPLVTVQVPAKFQGNWVRFLETNLNAEVPVENGATAGRYSVVIRFVVDKEGSVSDIVALTNHGYGMEQEALRVLRKAPKWSPAINNGYPVKAYHKQVIVFDVTD